MRASAAFQLMALALMPWFAGCAGSLGKFKPYAGVPELSAGDPLADQVLQIRYLGTGGMLLRHGANSIATAPFYSNPPGRKLLFLPIASDPAIVRRHIPPMADVSAILVGHAHYDHAMDLPFIATNVATNALIYGSETLQHILAPAVPAARVKALDARSAEGRRAGEWTPVAGGHIRFMALRRTHQPHFLGLTLYNGMVKEDYKKLPRTAWGWKCGQTFAYLIDFLDEDRTTVKWRVFYADAGHVGPDAGTLPELRGEPAKAIDVAIICLAHGHSMERIVTNMSPRTVVVGHWEDFSLPRNQPAKPMRFHDAPGFLTRLEKIQGTNWMLPARDAWMRFPIR